MTHYGHYFNHPPEYY